MFSSRILLKSFCVAWDEMVSEMGGRSMAIRQRGGKILNRHVGWIGGHLFEKKSIICCQGIVKAIYW